MRPAASYLVIVPGIGFLKIHGTTFFLARAKAAIRYACAPMDIKPAIRFTSRPELQSASGQLQ